MNNMVENAKKKYKDYNISETKLMDLLNEAIKSAKEQKDANISLDVLALSELDKKVCLYLKELAKTEEEDNIEGLEAIILVTEKYKYVFNRLKQKYTIEEKEDLIKEALLSYKGEEMFSLYLIHYVKEIQELKVKEETKEETIQNLDLDKLREVAQENKPKLQYNDEDSKLYKYYYDIDDIMNSDYSMQEKAIILLRFGYIDDNYYSEEQISNMLKLDDNFVKSVTTSNMIKLKIVHENTLSAHQSEKDKIESIQKVLTKNK